jgi:hypothetical protein
MSWKSLVTAGLVLIGYASVAPAQLDHYVCRQVKDLKIPAKFVAQPGIAVADQTAADTCDVKKLYMLCDPASKNGGPVNDLSAHLCCYKMTCSQKPAVNYQITDQFGTLTLQTKKPKFLCNPCTKAPA